MTEGLPKGQCGLNPGHFVGDIAHMTSERGSKERPGGILAVNSFDDKEYDERVQAYKKAHNIQEWRPPVLDYTEHEQGGRFSVDRLNELEHVVVDLDLTTFVKKRMGAQAESQINALNVLLALIMKDKGVEVSASTGNNILLVAGKLIVYLRVLANEFGLSLDQEKMFKIIDDFTKTGVFMNGAATRYINSSGSPQSDVKKMLFSKEGSDSPMWCEALNENAVSTWLDQYSFENLESEEKEYMKRENFIVGVGALTMEHGLIMAPQGECDFKWDLDSTFNWLSRFEGMPDMTHGYSESEGKVNLSLLSGAEHQHVTDKQWKESHQEWNRVWATQMKNNIFPGTAELERAQNDLKGVGKLPNVLSAIRKLPADTPDVVCMWKGALSKEGSDEDKKEFHKRSWVQAREFSRFLVPRIHGMEPHDPKLAVGKISMDAWEALEQDIVKSDKENPGRKPYVHEVKEKFPDLIDGEKVDVLLLHIGETNKKPEKNKIALIYSDQYTTEAKTNSSLPFYTVDLNGSADGATHQMREFHLTAYGVSKGEKVVQLLGGETKFNRVPYMIAGDADNDDSFFTAAGELALKVCMPWTTSDVLWNNASTVATITEMFTLVLLAKLDKSNLDGLQEQANGGANMSGWFDGLTDEKKKTLNSLIETEFDSYLGRR